jgi:hypothetical protein
LYSGGRFIGVPNVFSYFIFIVPIIIAIKMKAIECSDPLIKIEPHDNRDILSNVPNEVNTFTLNKANNVLIISSNQNDIISVFLLNIKTNNAI